MSASTPRPTRASPAPRSAAISMAPPVARLISCVLRGCVWPRRRTGRIFGSSGDENMVSSVNFNLFIAVESADKEGGLIFYKNGGNDPGLLGIFFGVQALK